MHNNNSRRATPTPYGHARCAQERSDELSVDDAWPRPEVVVVWPWEHLAIGYLVYSLVARYLGGYSPRTADAVALAIGTQFPDLVDKPLGWGTTLLPSGQTLAHSLLFAIPAVVLVVAIAHALGRSRVGVAFALGYLLHLPADAVYPLLVTGTLDVGFMFWPLIPAEASSTVSILPYVRVLGDQFLAFLATPRGRLYLLLEATLLSVTALRWYADGRPGLGRRFLGRATES